MSFLHQTITPIALHKFPNDGAAPIMVTRVQLCFTCTKIKTLQECTSVILECKGLSSDIEAKSNILQVFCQLLRVQWGSLESLNLEDGNLPFCPTCLKTIAEIIILREKLFQIETEIRKKLKNFEASVAECFQAYGNDVNKDTREEGSIKYDDLRIYFQKQVMEEYSNKELLQQKILEMKHNAKVVADECMPSLVQLHLTKNVFSIDSKQPSVMTAVKTINVPVVVCDTSTNTNNMATFERKSIRTDERMIKETPLQLGENVALNADGSSELETIHYSDASTNTKYLEILEHTQVDTSSQVDRIADIIVSDDDQPPVLEAQAPEVDEGFSLVAVGSDLNTSDDSDYGSPSKKSKTDMLNPHQVKGQNQTGIRTAVASVKGKVPTTEIQEQFISKYGSNSALLESRNTDTVNCRSEQQKTLYCDEDIEDSESDASDWVPKNGGTNTDSSNSESSDSDPEEQEPEDAGDDDKDEVAEDKDEVEEMDEDMSEEYSLVSIPELCKSQQFRPKFSAQSTAKSDPDELTCVKVIQTDAKFQARDKTVWTTEEPNQTRRKRAYEILREDGGLVGFAADSKLTPTQLFKLMFPPNIVETIVKHTNAYAAQMNNMDPEESAGNGRIKWVPVTVNEMYAYFGIFQYLGTDKKRCARSMWAKEPNSNSPNVTAPMSRDRFNLISTFLKFDDTEANTGSANEKEEDDESYVRISEVFEPFVENMQKHLKPYENLVLGEMFIRHHQGKAKLRTNSKSRKSGSLRHGFRIWALCDVETGYILKIALYKGKISVKDEMELGKNLVLNMVKKYFGSGRGVTMDKSFTSKALGEELIKQRMSMLGTLDHRRKDVISQFLDRSGREDFSSVFAFQNDFTMVSYAPRKRRAVLLLSTQHHSAEINSQDTYKPKMMLDYNSTIGGVDTAAHNIGKYSCQKGSKRWTVKVLQAFLDIAAFNAYAIHKLQKSLSEDTATVLGRKRFLVSLSKGLMKDGIYKLLQRPRPLFSLNSPTAYRRNITVFDELAVKKMQCSLNAVSPAMRKVFLRNFSEGLLQPSTATKVQRPPELTYFHNILRKLGYEVPEQETMESRTPNAMIGVGEVKPSRIVGRCHICPRGRKGRSASSTCHVCKKFVCLPCSVRPIHCRRPECTFVPPPPPRAEPRNNL